MPILKPHEQAHVVPWEPQPLDVSSARLGPCGTPALMPRRTAGLLVVFPVRTAIDVAGRQGFEVWDAAASPAM